MTEQIPRLTRRALGLGAAPVRVVHLGLGAFHRAHQAWYTHQANVLGGPQWGIAAFTGRRPDQAAKLAPQDGLYFLVTRGPTDDGTELVASLTAVHNGADADAWLGYFRNPAVGIVTLTVTEAGYRRGPGGHLDFDDAAVADDLRLLRSGRASAAVTAPGKLVQGLAARRDAGLGGLAVVSCDNLPGNGSVASTVVLDLCTRVDATLAAWVRENVTFPSTMVDRITPHTVRSDLDEVDHLTGWHDESPVVTELYSEWVIEDDFPLGAPDWSAVGAELVADVTPYERRKLALLNGGHSLLAYGASILGHDTVADAVSDPTCVAMLEDWWREVGPVLDFDDANLADYRASLLARWANARIRHRLDQIAADGSQKVPVRVGAVLEFHRARGEMPDAGASLVGAWIAHLRGHGAPVQDVDDALVESARGDLAAAAATILAHVCPALAGDEELTARIIDHTSRWETTQ